MPPSALLRFSTSIFRVFFPAFWVYLGAWRLPRGVNLSACLPLQRLFEKNREYLFLKAIAKISPFLWFELVTLPGTQVGPCAHFECQGVYLVTY